MQYGREAGTFQRNQLPASSAWTPTNDASGSSQTYVGLLISTADRRDNLQTYQELSFLPQRLYNSEKDCMTTDVRYVLK